MIGRKVRTEREKKGKIFTKTIPLILKTKSQSNLIFKTKSNKIMFDRDFIFKMMPKKIEHLRGNFMIQISFPPQQLRVTKQSRQTPLSLPPTNNFIHNR